MYESALHIEDPSIERYEPQIQPADEVSEEEGKDSDSSAY